MMRSEIARQRRGDLHSRYSSRQLFDVRELKEHEHMEVAETKADNAIVRTHRFFGNDRTRPVEHLNETGCENSRFQLLSYLDVNYK